MKDQLKLSIVIPTFNKAEYLQLLLSSILKQDYCPSLYEVIVVNDGSTDGTDGVMKHYQPLFANFQSVHQTNQGIGAARNAGISVARGELIAFLADDYILEPEYCSSLTSVFDDEKIVGIRADVGSVGGSAIEKAWLNECRLDIWHAIHGHQIKPTLCFPGLKLDFPDGVARFQETVSWCGGAMMRRWIFRKYGLFREDMKTCEDVEMGMRLAANGIPLHFYPRRLLNIAFRKKLGESLKRNYQYRSDGRTLSQKYAGSAIPKRTAGQKAYTFLRRSIELLCMAESLAQAARMAPYVLLARVAILLGYLHG